MSSVLVRLPRECSGAEILEAFRDASTFQDAPDRKWSAVGFESKSGVASKESTYEAERGMYATPTFRKAQNRISRRLFGVKPDKWETVAGGDLAKFDTQVMLHPVQPSENYAQVELTVHHVYGYADPMLVGALVASSPDMEGFQEIRPAYNRIMMGFLARLQIQT